MVKRYLNNFYNYIMSCLDYHFSKLFSGIHITPYSEGPYNRIYFDNDGIGVADPNTTYMFNNR